MRQPRKDVFMRFRVPHELRERFHQMLPKFIGSRLIRAFLNRLLEDLKDLTPEAQDLLLYNLELGNFSLVRGIKRRPHVRPPEGWKGKERGYDGRPGKEDHPGGGGRSYLPLAPDWWEGADPASGSGTSG